MKLASASGRATVEVAGTWIDVQRASKGKLGPTTLDVYENWAAFTDWAATLDEELGEPKGGTRRGLDSAPRQNPSPAARQVFAIGANYHDHAQEMRLAQDDLVSVFTKYPTCLTGDGALIRLPSQTIDWEVELVLIIGRGGYRIPETKAWDHIAGLTVGQDLTDRELQAGQPSRQFSLAKSFAGAGPCGPYLVTPDEFPNPDDLEIGCSFEGETIQLARTSQMRKSPAELVAELSSHVRLLPGDLIFTGSPGGAGHSRAPRRYLTEGRLDSWVEGIGTLTVNLIPSESGHSAAGP